jgi:hypothetical protein
LGEIPVSFSIRGEPLPISSREATVIALVVNELIDNSISHGLAAEGGRVEVDVWLDHGDVCAGSTRRWARHPAGPPRQSSGLGLSIIETLVSVDLGGQFVFSRDDEWAHARIRFPIYCSLNRRRSGNTRNGARSVRTSRQHDALYFVLGLVDLVESIHGIDRYTRTSPGCPVETDGDEVLERARAAGVRYLVNIGYDLPSSAASVELARLHPHIFATAGIQPHYARETGPEEFAQLQALLDAPKVVALGEIGLDYHHDRAPRVDQQALFERQLGIAAERQLPVVSIAAKHRLIR